MTESIPAVITIGIDPTIELGPITLAWHGMTIAVGILVGAAIAKREARRLDLAVEPLEVIALILIAGALVGARVFYLAEHGQLLEPSQWLGTTGFTFYGGFIGAATGIVFYIWRRRLPLYYLDAIAAGVPLGLAVGRIGDVINGEHYGPATDFLLGVRNTHPDALTPNPQLAYHSGGLYEVLLGLAIFAIIWPLRPRLRQPTALVWSVLAMLAAGRFLEFFARSDSQPLALGLVTAQWTSVLLLAVAAVGALLTVRQSAARDHRRASASRPGGTSRPH